MFCLACRRPLTNETSRKYQLGPVCLRKAVKAGTAPIEALTELTAEQRGKKRRIANKPAPIREHNTMDLFDQLKAAAMDDLSRAVIACESVGIKVNWSIES